MNNKLDTSVDKPLPALFLTPDSVEIETEKLMGRQSAGNGFLRAYVKAFAHEGAALPIMTFNPKSHDALNRAVAMAGWRGKIDFLSPYVAQSGHQFDVLYYPAPISNEFAWQRARGAATDFAMCGVTHTTCTLGVMQQISDYLTEPFASWDALVCTSNSVLTSVQRIWEVRMEALSHKFGHALPMPASVPMTPVIPLGVHCDDFVPSEFDRIAGRAQWNFEPDEVVVLFVGRLSMHAKANPMPMYLACARAARQTGKKVHVLECGWFANEAIRDTFAQAADIAGIKVTHVDGRVPGVTRRAYAASDIFMSLSDNIQETFGLTPVEAMASGLPVIVSDWDGYRETVRDGVDGFLIPTTQPNDLLCAEDVINGYADGRLSYDLYVAHAHMLVSVDVHACTHALCQLLDNPDLRRSMGASGRERAQAVYDWSVVMGQYQQLWQEQDEKRLKCLMDAKSGASAHPEFFSSQPQLNAAKLSPLDLFLHYPSHHVDEDTLFWLDDAVTDIPAAVAKIRGMMMWNFSQTWLADAEFFTNALAKVPVYSVDFAAKQYAPTVKNWAFACKMPVPRAIRFVTWLHKVGLVRVSL